MGIEMNDDLSQPDTRKNVKTFTTSGTDGYVIEDTNSEVCRLKERIKELEAEKKDILRAVVSMDYGYIESVYLGYDDDGRPPKNG